MKDTKTTGTLYVVSTPIGNLKDITLRALETLREVSAIFSEDTRKSRILLKHFQIEKTLYSYYSYNEKKQISKILTRLKRGEDLALVSDAGTPCISDPGTLLMARLHEEGITVVPIPGVCAFVTLFAVSGFPNVSLQFLGFLSPKKSRRKKRLLELLDYNGVLALYESPHRISALIEEIDRVFPESRILVGRELTKKFEEFYRGLARDWIGKTKTIRGEYCILIDRTRN